MPYYYFIFEAKIFTKSSAVTPCTIILLNTFFRKSKTLRVRPNWYSYLTSYLKCIEIIVIWNSNIKL